MYIKKKIKRVLNSNTLEYNVHKIIELFKVSGMEKLITRGWRRKGV